LNELELFYNFPLIQDEESGKRFDPCPHIPKLLCSRAHELAPDKCISERKCELYFNRDGLTNKNGIHAPTLQRIDKEIRER
ncbi:MAG: hypothetical protein ACXAE3_15345, partial [Candidatus Kariarchaeaceae archaeon]